METLKGLAEKYAQRDDLYTEDGEYTKTTVINAFNDGAKAMLQVIGYSLAAHQHKETKVTTKKEREWLIKQINKTNMEVQELRIGNIVEVNHFEYGDMFASVTSINDVGDLCLHLLDERFNKEEYECTMNEVTPIPITEELLLEIGFKRDRNGYFSHKECDDKLSIRFSRIYTFIEYANLHFNPEDVTETNYGSSLEFPNTLHLHTLQNIWHLLTGKELEIKL